MAYKVTMGQAFLLVIPYSPLPIIPPSLHIDVLFQRWEWPTHTGAYPNLTVW
jgi:hypothetical protein